MKVGISMPLALALLCEVFGAVGVLAAKPLNEASISELEERRDSIRAELEQLAVLTLRTGAMGTSGYRSFPQEQPEIEGEWLRVDFDEEAIDEVVLVPTLWRYDDEVGYLSDGFPEAFRVVAGLPGEDEGTVVAVYDSSNNLLPRVAPVVVPLGGMVASWVRIEPTLLTRRRRDLRYIFQLSEILVFSGEKNIALHQKVTCASDVPLSDGIWKPDRVTDGGMPYLMDSSRGSERSAHFQESSEDPSLTLDLEEEYLISTIHLHGAYQSKSAPPEFNVNRGIPSLLIVEGANQADFSDSTLLLKHQFRSIGEFAPILMWNIPPTECRYVRISSGSFDEKMANTSSYQGSEKIGFAEVEFFSGGTNIAFEKGPPEGSEITGESRKSLAKLTDGHNIYGFILPIRSWMNQLARRHDLEVELALVNPRLDELYGRQKASLLLLKRLTIALVCLVAATILIGRHLRLRQAARIKERFTADLHDHVGASLHAIGILSSHTKDIVDSPDKLAMALGEIEAMTHRASEATRYLCSQHMAKEAHENLLADLRRTAGRMIANLSYTFTVEGESYLQQLSPRMRSDFFLFFKECLINVNRHADATEVTILIEADSREVHLSICDNGCGIEERAEGTVPPSLARRARYLRSTVKIKTPPDGGSCISLVLRNRRRWFPKLL
ncbi:ATP-binding protein [Roseibacillus persicicus]|uniref:sensor histidine kinase n=1 Tax=Roseibacillus persicicus TaxID=454148 RepID=UPI00398A6E3C